MQQEIDFSKVKKVVCISHFYNTLTFEKVYDVEDRGPDWISVMADNNKPTLYPLKYTGLYNFVSLSHFRKYKLSKLNDYAREIYN